MVSQSHRARTVRRLSAVPAGLSPRERDGYQKQTAELPIFDRLTPRKRTEAGNGASAPCHYDILAGLRASDQRGKLRLGLRHRYGRTQ